MRACETLWDLVRPCETVGDRAGAQSGVEILILSRWDNIENPYSYVVEETYVDAHPEWVDLLKNTPFESPERILVYLDVRAWPSDLPERILVYPNVLPPPRLLRLHLRHRAAARRLF